MVFDGEARLGGSIQAVLLKLLPRSASPTCTAISNKHVHHAQYSCNAYAFPLKGGIVSYLFPFSAEALHAVFSLTVNTMELRVHTILLVFLYDCSGDVTSVAPPPFAVFVHYATKTSL